eukprot:SAG31_NODE_9045_length_1343_cov_1.925241_1_plen_207_part_01
MFLAVLTAVIGLGARHQPDSGGLGGAISAILARPELRGTHWGIDVSNGSTTSVYAHNADSFFIPASNKKLLASASALLTHGPDYRFRTPLLVDATGSRVVICGNADPSVSLHALQVSAQELAPHLAGILRHKNVAVLAVPPPGFDQSANPGSSSVDSWEYGDLSEAYGAQPAAFAIDALLPVNATALGERMPNSMLLEFAPGAAIGD